MSAALSLPLPVRPPAEFLGQARQFRAALRAADAKVARTVNGITASLAARVQRGKATFRDGALIDLARRGETAGYGIGRLAMSIERGKGRLRVSETRASAGRFSFVRWGDDAQQEQDIGIFVGGLAVEPGRAVVSPPIVLASVGMHAAGRWFQRKLIATPAALHDDLREITAQHARIIDGPWDREFEIVAARGGGKWLGAVALIDAEGSERPMLSVRTFVS